MSDSVDGVGLSESNQSTLRADRIRLCLIAMLTNVSAGLYSFAVPRLLAQQETSSLLQVATVGSFLMFGYGITAFISGHLSDKIGRRRMIATAGACACVVTGISVFIESVSFYYLLIFLLGMANGSVFPATIGALTSQTSKEADSRVLLFFTLSWNLGLMIGGFAAGVLLEYAHGLTWVFISCSASMLTVCLLGSGLSHSEAAKDTEHSQRDVETVMRGRWFAAIGWTGLVAGIFAVALVQYVFPKLAVQLGISPSIHGTMLTVHRFGGLVIYLVLSTSAIWRYRFWSVVFGNVCGAAGLFALIIGSGHLALYAGMVLTAVFAGVCYFSAIIYGSSAFRPENRGKAGGIHETIIAFSFVLGPICGGWIGDRTGSIRVAFQLGAAVLGIAMLAQSVLFLVYQKRRNTNGL